MLAMHCCMHYGKATCTPRLRVNLLLIEKAAKHHGSALLRAPWPSIPSLISSSWSTHLCIQLRTAGVFA